MDEVLLGSRTPSPLTTVILIFFNQYLTINNLEPYVFEYLREIKTYIKFKVFFNFCMLDLFYFF